jgi:hypothetical protein
MLTGKQFQLRTPTIALDVVNGQPVAVTIPFEAVITVTSEPSTSDHGMLNVLWADRTIRMFAIDVNRRGTEIIVS